MGLTDGFLPLVAGGGGEVKCMYVACVLCASIRLEADAERLQILLGGEKAYIPTGRLYSN